MSGKQQRARWRRREQAHAAALLEVRDHAAQTRQRGVALWLACQAPILPAEQRSALCALADAVRSMLDGVVSELDRLLAGRAG